MTRKVLIIGGTRFFGKHLVERLISNGDQVTVASRNFSKFDLSSKVRTVHIDRESFASLEAVLSHEKYDLIYDQICYAPSAADYVCKLIKDESTQLIHTSTQSVYITNDLQKETDFEPHTYPIRLGQRSEFNYGEGKRLAEAVYFQNANFPVIAVRFPFVLGENDYTERLTFHIDRVKNGRPIVAPNPSARTSLINAQEAASFLDWIGRQERFTGPINACSIGEISLSGILKTIEEVVGKRAVITSTGKEGSESPYAQTHSRYLDPSKAIDMGFKFSHLNDWLSALIQSQSKI